MAGRRNITTGIAFVDWNQIENSSMSWWGPYAVRSWWNPRVRLEQRPARSSELRALGANLFV